MDRGKLHFEYPVYPDLTLLPKNKWAYACWYYYTLAQKLSEMLGDGRLSHSSVSSNMSRGSTPSMSRLHARCAHVWTLRPR
jgi:hypothetical protein